MSACKEAELRGERYYDGRPCINCGTTKRLVANRVCYECNKRKARERAQRKKLEQRVVELEQLNDELLQALLALVNECLYDGRNN